MRAITVMRAAAWAGLAIAGWSLNIRWGVEEALGNGPPGQWERLVVAAALLSFTAALALSVTGRGEQPPGWIARGIAVAASMGAMAIVYSLRSDALHEGNPEMIQGPGWTWLAIGVVLVWGASWASIGLRRREQPTPAQRSRGRRRGRNR